MLLLTPFLSSLSTPRARPIDNRHSVKATTSSLGKMSRMDSGSLQFGGALTDVNNTGKAPGQILDDSQNVKNDIAEAMLGLFVSWECLQGLLEKYGVNKFPEPRDACALIWSKVRPELPLYLQRLAEKFSCLHRSKEDAGSLRALRYRRLGSEPLRLRIYKTVT
ncbi:hypothetical protein V8E54_006272 [Elaphomyces granulatus]